MKLLTQIAHSRYRSFLSVPMFLQMFVMLVMAFGGRPATRSNVPDWFLHITAYYILYILAWIGCHGLFPHAQSKACRNLALVITVCFSFIDEGIQSFVPVRHGALFDVAVDVAGALLAYLVIACIFYKKQNLDAPRH